jgi:hypothetical protein
MEGARRRRPSRPRSRFLRVEALEDRTLLSSSCPISPLAAGPAFGPPPPSVAVPTALPEGTQPGTAIQALLSLAGTPATPAPTGSADGAHPAVAGDHPWLSLLASPALATWGNVPGGQGTPAGIEGPFRYLEDPSDVATAPTSADHQWMPEHTLGSSETLSEGSPASDPAANGFQAALALISAGSTLQPPASGFSGNPFVLSGSDPLRASYPWVMKLAGMSDMPGFLQGLDDIGEVRAPHAPPLFGGENGAGMPAGDGAFGLGLGALPDHSHWLYESREGYSLWNFRLAAEGLPGHGSTPILVPSVPGTGYILSVDPPSTPGALGTPLDAADAHRLGPDHGEATAARLARPEATVSRVVVDTTVLSHPDGSVEAGTVKEAARAGSSAFLVAPSGQLTGMTDPTPAALFGAPSADSDGPGGRLFVAHAAIPVAVQGRVVVPAVASSGDAGAADSGADAGTTPSPAAEAVKVAVQPGALLEGGLPFDLPVLRQEVDAFFARLGALEETGAGLATWARFVPWLVVLSAAAAVEFVRRREKEGSPRPLSPDHVLLGATFLPERER